MNDDQLNQLRHQHIKGKVRRYVLEWLEPVGAKMTLDPSGAWIEHEDYLLLANRVKELEAALRLKGVDIDD